MKCTPSGRCGATASTTACFTDPTSVTDGPRLQMWCDFCSNRLHRADRHAQDDKISPLHRLGRRLGHPVTEQRQRHRPRLGRFGMAHDLTGQPARPHRMRHGRGDQPKTDQGDTLVDHRAAHLTPLNCATAWATCRQDDSSPMVIRRQCGSL